MSMETNSNVNSRELAPGSTAGQLSPGFILPSFGHPAGTTFGLHQPPTQSVPPPDMHSQVPGGYVGETLHNNMGRFNYFRGIITMINDFFVKEHDENIGCYKLITVEDALGSVVNFVVAPTTYFVDHVTVSLGDMVIGFYDALAPAPLIFPPQYWAVVMAVDTPYKNVKVDFFDNQLLSADKNLKLNLSPYTRIVLENNQLFTRNPGNRNLIVVYGPVTRSIPAQTTPYEIIVMC